MIKSLWLALGENYENTRPNVPVRTDQPERFSCPENSYFGSPNHELCDLSLYRGKALQKVDGVSKAEVTFKTKLAVVTFDDEKTTVKALTEATTNAGYPSTLKE